MGFSPSRVIAVGLTLVFLSLAGCARRGSERSCAAPRLVVSPAKVAPGDSVTITWNGVVKCDDDGTLTHQGSEVAIISLAKWSGYPTPEPYTPPVAAVENWTEISLDSSPPPTATAVVPKDLPSGTYYVFVQDAGLIMS